MRESSKRSILLLVLVTAAAGYLWWDRSTAVEKVGDTEKRISVAAAEQARTAAAKGLKTAPAYARKLGIAYADFIRPDTLPEEPSEPERELTKEELRLIEQFKTGALSRIGNSAVFVTPDATDVPGASNLDPTPDEPAPKSEPPQKPIPGNQKEQRR